MKSPELDKVLATIDNATEGDTSYLIILHGTRDKDNPAEMNCHSVMYGNGPSIAKAITESMDLVTGKWDKASVFFARKGIEYMEQAKQVIRDSITGPNAVPGLKEDMITKMKEAGIDTRIIDLLDEEGIERLRTIH